jgi:4-hydroxy-2-oxoheptanedioate aldolase
MELPVNHLKRALKSGELVSGIWFNLCSEFAMEVVMGSGLDFVIIDTEHGPIDLFMLVRMLQASLASKTQPIVRVPWNDQVMIKRVLDAGAQSLLIPMVQTEEEAKRAVANTRYPPEGVRGSAGPTRASRFQRIKDYAKLAANELCVIVQVETRLGVKNAEAISRVEGVDSVFLGPGDLSMDMGHVGNMAHPEVQKALEESIAVIKRCGKAPGILTVNEAQARRYVDLGAKFITVGSDVAILARETEKLAATFNAWKKP